MKKLVLNRETLTQLSEATKDVQGGMPGGSGRTVPKGTVDSLGAGCAALSVGGYRTHCSLCPIFTV